MRLFRFSLHRNSYSLGNMIKSVKRHGYLFRDGKKYKLISARRDGVMIHLSVEHMR